MSRRLGHAILVAALALPGLALADALDGAVGKALFDRIWVRAPSSTAANDGLGPLFNEASCAACHSGKALSARIAVAPDGTVTARGLVARLGDEAGDPDPLYGRQFQPKAVAGLTAEGTIAYHLDAAADRIDISLAPSRGALSPSTRLGPRQAPSLRGIGRVGRIDDRAIEALADPGDRDHDGISGRIRWIEKDGGRRIGRYGWKASAADLDHQVADAFALDIGMSSPFVPLPAGDCTAAEADCRNAPDGRSAAFDGEEVSREMVHLVSAYLDGLKVPSAAPPAGGPALFAAAGCAACHVPALPDRQGNPVAIFSDLLLHDMGPALDDGAGEAGVPSYEWRTAPLFSLAVRQEADRRYLHDGRAGTLDAAVRAHGGEAAAARKRYEAMTDDDRAALIAYLETL